MAVLRHRTNLTTDGSGAISTSVKIYDPTLSTDWVSFTNLYDAYRVCAVKLQFIPFRNSAENATGALNQFQPMYLAHDFDSALATISPATIMDYRNFRFKNMARPWQYYFRVPKRMFSQNGNSLGYIDVINPQTTIGFTYIATEPGAPLSTNLGQLIVSYYVKFINRR